MGYPYILETKYEEYVQEIVTYWRFQCSFALASENKAIYLNSGGVVSVKSPHSSTAGASCSLSSSHCSWRCLSSPLPGASSSSSSWGWGPPWGSSPHICRTCCRSWHGRWRTVTSRFSLCLMSALVLSCPCRQWGRHLFRYVWSLPIGRTNLSWNPAANY